MKKSLNPWSCRLRLTPTNLLFACLLLVSTSQLALGQAIYTTKFEPGMFLDDTALVGQDGWSAPGILSPNAAVVTADKPRQGRQSVHVLGDDLEHQDFINAASGGYYAAIGSYRRAVNHDTGHAQTVRISAHVRIDGPLTSSGQNFFSASLAGRAESTLDGEPSSASVGELAISSDGHAYAYSGNDFVPTFLASVPVTPGQWHNLAVVADFATQTSAFYVNDVLLTTFAWAPGEVYTGVLLRGAVLAYAAPDTATNQKADYAASYDNFAIRVTGK